MRIISENKKEMEIEGEDLTLFSMLHGYLSEMEEVEFTAFKRKHPLENKVFLYVRVRSGSPRDALKKAAEMAREDATSLIKEMG